MSCNARKEICKSNQIYGEPKSVFRRVKDFLFPIESHEWKKVFPLMLMMMLCCFNYTLAKDMKILQQSERGSQEVGLFQKFFWVMPLSIVFMVVYTKLDTKYSKPTVFYSILGFFTVFYALYLIFVVIEASQVQIRPDSGWAKHTSKEVKFTEWLLTTIETWVETFLGIISELWGTVMLGLMFWGFANSICNKEEAMRFYPVINISATVSTMFSGILTLAMGQSKPPKHIQDIIPAIFAGVILIFCVGIGLCYRYMQKHVLTDPVLCPPEVKKGGKKKVKLGFADSLKFVFTSSYVAMIAGIVACYNMMNNFLEQPYHYNILKYKAQDQQSTFKGIETLLNGFMVLVFLVTVGSRSVRLFGWTRTALVSPSVIAIFGTVTMIFQLANFKIMNVIYKKDKLKQEFNDEEKGIINIVYWLSMLTVLFARSLKYSFFDPTKELVYLPLDQDLRGKAKAAVDVVGARFGKSFPALIQLILLSTGFNNAMEYFYVTFGLYVVFMVLWIICTVYLGRAYNRFEAAAKEEESSQESTMELQLTNLSDKKEKV